MAVYTGSRSITESLILVLDPDDTRLSFLGEPTTNVLNNTNLDLGWEKGYHYDVIIGDSYPKPPGITSQSVHLELQIRMDIGIHTATMHRRPIIQLILFQFGVEQSVKTLQFNLIQQTITSLIDFGWVLKQSPVTENGNA